MSLNTPQLRVGSGLVLLAPGGLPDQQAGTQLAGLLGLRLISPPKASPAEVLAALSGLPPGWLWPLEVDPGQDLSSGGCWADVLGAWRQPVLLLLPDQAPAGAPRAYSALLQSRAVPLLGLLQMGGDWQPEQRRRDGLAWLGWLPPGPTDPVLDDACVELVAACRRRWRELSAARPDGPM